MKQFLIMTILFSKLTSASNMFCEINGKEITLKTIYTCSKDEQRIEYSSFEDITEKKEAKYGESFDFHNHCKNVTEYNTFTFRDKNYTLSRSSFYADRPDSNLIMSIEAFSLERESENGKKILIARDVAIDVPARINTILDSSENEIFGIILCEYR